MRHPSLSDLFDAEKETIIDRCTLCGVCVEVCPVYPLIGTADENPSRVQEARIDVLRGKPAANEIYDFIWACSRCGRCMKGCPEGLNPYLMQYILRREMIRLGQQPPETAPAQPPRPYTDARILSGVPDRVETSDVVYFPGCNAVRVPSVVYRALDILDRMGVSCVTLAGKYGDVCCGSPHMTRGEPEKAERAARQLVSVIDGFSPKKVILKCPGCMNRLQNLFSKIIDFTFEIQYVSDFLNENLDKALLANRVEKRVTLHDGCNLGRGLEKYDTVRNLLQSVPGLDLVEMGGNRENASCCYSAPTSQWYPTLANTIREKTLLDAENKQVHVLATTCGGCFRTFSAYRYPDGSTPRLKVEDFITIVSESMGIVRPDDIS
jgi:Fe-S oxidoreductase